MKREITPPARGLLIVYRCVVALLLALVLALAAGSLYALIRPADSQPLFRIKSAARGQTRGPARQKLDPAQINTFSGVGRLRIPSEGDPPATLILSISFPYSTADRAFAEELASRVGEFRSIAAGYFSSLPPEKIRKLDEEAAKKEILSRYNAILRLGKIEALYFGDLMVIE